jgi:hypothetical protein
MPSPLAVHSGLDFSVALILAGLVALAVVVVFTRVWISLPPIPPH